MEMGDGDKLSDMFVGGVDEPLIISLNINTAKLKY